MKRILAAAGIALILTTTSCGPGGKTFSGSAAYFNYSIKYPPDWKATNIHGFAYITAPVENVNFKENVLISVGDSSKKPMSLEKFENDIWLKALAPSAYDNFKILEKGKTTIKGRKTLFHIYTYTDGKLKIKLKCKRYAFLNGTNVYELTYEAREEHYDTYVNQAENIIKSIKVKK